MPVKYAFLRYALPGKYAIFNRKTLCLKCFFSTYKKKKTYKQYNKKILYLFIYYTVLNLDKLKLKEPKKSYELKKCLSKFKSFIKNKNITDITNLIYKKVIFLSGKNIIKQLKI